MRRATRNTPSGCGPGASAPPRSRLFKIDPSRASEVLVDVLGEEFHGVLGCDYFSAYRKYMGDFNVLVQFCLAHLIRDVRVPGRASPTPAIGPMAERAADGVARVVRT